MAAVVVGSRTEILKRHLHPSSDGSQKAVHQSLPHTRYLHPLLVIISCEHSSCFCYCGYCFVAMVISKRGDSDFDISYLFSLSMGVRMHRAFVRVNACVCVCSLNCSFFLCGEGIYSLLDSSAGVLLSLTHWTYFEFMWLHTLCGNDHMNAHIF